MTNIKFVKAGAQAIDGEEATCTTGYYGASHRVDAQHAPDLAAAVIAAVEPLIRADEQERHGSNCGGMWDEWLDDLRGKVQALRDDEAEVARKGRSDARCFVAAYEVVLTLLDEGETEPPTDMDVWNRTFGSSK